jgi:acyl carrier protein phosphodiesterase
LNFFGHAVMAAFENDAPRFVLGAMLPDLSTMAGARIERVNDAEIAAGVAHHHRIDHAFHGCAPFVRSCAAALETLQARGVSRAAARAVGHVGSELLLDGALSTRSDALRAYARSLRDALEQRAADHVSFRGESQPVDFHRMLAQLAAAPLPGAYRDPEFVCSRLQRILAHRPRLALQAHEIEPVHQWLVTAHARIDDDAAAILALLRAMG